MNDAAVAWDRANKERILQENAIRQKSDQERDAFEEGVAKKMEEQIVKVASVLYWVGIRSVLEQTTDTLLFRTVTFHHTHSHVLRTHLIFI